MEVRRADPIRLIALRLSQDELRHLTFQPGINEAFRITIQYHDGRHPNQVATLTRNHTGAAPLTVVYDKPGKDVRFSYPIPPERYQSLLLALRRIKFDKLDDQPEVPFFGVDLWLVERASGSFYHDVVLSPDSARGFYRELILALRTHLKEALREIPS
ncbi:hypothetical protein [Aggregatilinea lenta]|uniref:hypothetical protein n=1 Tax=Aggregatilinea lenta TaxID=913108 RepID=UPI000E5BC54D|nr:hypothetical protein [Aggregatilinea lenta]